MGQVKPIILWTCDVRGWAYHTRVETMSRALPDYQHRVWISSNVPLSLLRDMMRRADIIVCQGIKVVARTIAAGADPRKIVVRLDSVRVDDAGRYVDVFVKSPKGKEKSLEA